MGGGWNYRRLRLLHHKHKNLSQFREEQLEERSKHDYPFCRGSFDTCPSEDEFISVKDNPENPPEICRRCPFFHESKFFVAKPREINPNVLKMLQGSR